MSKTSVHTIASTTQQPWGQQADIEWAREYVQTKIGDGRVLHAVLRPTPESIKIISTRHMRCFVFMPCIWPHMLLASPCLIACCLNTRQSLSHMRYIVTNREICRIILDHNPPCICTCTCCGTVTSACDTKIVPIQYILSCDYNHTGHDCIKTDVNSARINQAGEIIMQQYYVKEPEQFVRLVNELRDAHALQHHAPTSPSAPPSYAYGSAPTSTCTCPSAPPAYGSSEAVADPIIATSSSSSSGLRIFVALASNPSQFEIIVNFQPHHQGLDGLSKLVADKFHQPGGRYAFSLAEIGIGAAVTDVQAIQGNDKLIATKTI